MKRLNIFQFSTNEFLTKKCTQKPVLKIFLSKKSNLKKKFGAFLFDVLICVENYLQIMAFNKPRTAR